MVLGAPATPLDLQPRLMRHACHGTQQCWCGQAENPDERPTMSDVEGELEAIIRAREVALRPFVRLRATAASCSARPFADARTEAAHTGG